MSSSNDTNRIEAGDLLIETNADGEIEIHNLADGESVTLGSSGFSASAIDTEKIESIDYDYVWNARQYMLQNGFTDIGNAINDIIATITNEETVGGYKIVIPQPRLGDPSRDGSAWEFSSISVPFQNSKARKIALVGAGDSQGAVQMRPLDADIAIRKEPAGGFVSGSDQDESFTVANLRLVDQNDVATKLLEINDTFRPRVENCIFRGGANTDVCVELRGRDNGIFFARIDKCYYRFGSGSTGLKLGDSADPTQVNASTIIDNVFTADSDRVGIGLEATSQAHCTTVLGGDCEKAQSGYKLGGESFQLLGVRFEGPYGPSGGIQHPVEVTSTARRGTITPNYSDREIGYDFVKESIWRGIGVELEPALRIGADAGFGNFPAEWDSNPSVNDGSISRQSGRTVLQTPATGSGMAAYSFNGVGSVGTTDASRFDARINYSADTDWQNSITRVGWRRNVNEYAMLIADPTDALGTGITSNWIAQTIGVNGEHSNSGSPTDTQKSLTATNTDVVLSVVPERASSPIEYRYLIDGEQVAHHSDNSNVAVPEPFVSIEETDATQRTMYCSGVVARVASSRGNIPL